MRLDLNYDLTAVSSCSENKNKEWHRAMVVRVSVTEQVVAAPIFISGYQKVIQQKNSLYHIKRYLRDIEKLVIAPKISSNIRDFK